MSLTTEERELLERITGLCDTPEGAYNFRLNGKSIGRHSTGNIEIRPKEGGRGLDIFVSANTKNETMHIPVMISAGGVSEVVENDFYIAAGADVTIIAGCGIYNCSGVASEHDGVHRLYIESGAKVKYIEKHYGFGERGSGRILNPSTKAYLAENSELIMELEQIRGVTSAKRTTFAKVGDGARFTIHEKILTHGKQTAVSKIKVDLAGENSVADIVSRAVAQDISKQKFYSEIIGKKRSKGHSECDAIIMDQATVLARPALDARSVDSELIHEAAIGKISGEQLVKLMTLGLSEKEAESTIINGFLK